MSAHSAFRRFGAGLAGLLGLVAIVAICVAAATAPDGDAFARARARGALVVGVPYLAPPAAAGAKIRSPERLDTAIANHLGERLGLPVTLRQVDAADAPALLAAGEIDAALSDRVEGLSRPGQQAPGVVVVPTGYVVRPQAVIRGDTSMRDWRDTSGHSICMAGAAVQAREWASHWTNKARIYLSPSDALVAVREGACDLALVDDAVWTPLMRFPEWHKYSATLPLEAPAAERVWLVAGQAEARSLGGEMRGWKRGGAWQAMTAQWARDVAFDVYLDQEVPDCHGG